MHSFMKQVPVLLLLGAIATASPITPRSESTGCDCHIRPDRRFDCDGVTTLLEDIDRERCLIHMFARDDNNVCIGGNNYGDKSVSLADLKYSSADITSPTDDGNDSFSHLKYDSNGVVNGNVNGNFRGMNVGASGNNLGNRLVDVDASGKNPGSGNGFIDVSTDDKSTNIGTYVSGNSENRGIVVGSNNLGNRLVDVDASGKNPGSGNGFIGVSTDDKSTNIGTSVSGNSENRGIVVGSNIGNLDDNGSNTSIHFTNNGDGGCR